MGSRRLEPFLDHDHRSFGDSNQVQIFPCGNKSIHEFGLLPLFANPCTIPNVLSSLISTDYGTRGRHGQDNELCE